MIDADKAEFRRLVEAYDRYYALMQSERPGSDIAQQAAWCTHDARVDLQRFLLSHASELLAVVEAQGHQQPWSQDISGAIWAEIRSGLTGRFEEQFMLHQQADRYERSSAHLDECARILTRRIEDKLWPTPPEPAQ